MIEPKRDGAGPEPLAPPSYDRDALRVALAAIPEGAWSLPSTFVATGLHEGYRRIQLITNGIVQRYPPAQQFVDLFDFVLRDFAPINLAWLSWLDPGGYINPHSDGGPWRERWHVPIQAAGVFNDQRAEDAVPFRVEQWRKHSVTNDTDYTRVHLVIDKDIIVGPEEITRLIIY